MKVSVLIPYYNDERFLRQAIESVLAQTFRDFELVLVNHASTDGSRVIARSFGGKHVEQLAVEHGPEKLLRFGRKLAVEFHALGQDLIAGPHGTRVAGAEFERIVGKAHRVLLAQTLCLLAVDLIRHGDEILHHRRAEFLHVRLGVADGSGAVVRSHKCRYRNIADSDGKLSVIKIKTLQRLML